MVQGAQGKADDFRPPKLHGAGAREPEMDH